MISLRRSGSGFIVGSTDINHLEDVAGRALGHGETVELQLDAGPWREVTTREEARTVLDELLDELDDRREELDLSQLPIEDLL